MRSKIDVKHDPCFDKKLMQRLYLLKSQGEKRERARWVEGVRMAGGEPLSRESTVRLSGSCEGVRA